MGSMQASRVPVGLDFFGLREYEVGDDLRRVHWRSTARTGELMLRQDEMPWEARSTILLDTRPSTHHGESFERAVEIAASLATAMCRGRRQVRFMTTGGVDIRSSGVDRYAQIMEYLAGCSVETYVRWEQVMEGLRRTAEGPLAAIVADVERTDLVALGALRPRLGLVFLCAIRPSAYGEVDVEPGPGRPRRPRGARLLRQSLPDSLELGGGHVSARRSGSLLTLAALSVVAYAGLRPALRRRLLGAAGLPGRRRRPRRRAGDAALAHAAGRSPSPRWPWAC